jgi:hypothetical protein
MKTITFIYLIKFDGNKVYIGKTINKTQRKNAHKKKYDIIDFIIIDEIESLNRNDWEPLETKWIKHYTDLGFEVMNIRKKGGSGPEYRTEEDKKRIGDKNRHPKPKGFGLKVSLGLKGKKHGTKNWKPTDEHIAAIKKANSKPNSEETKKKISKSLLKGGNKIISQKKKEWYINNIHPKTRQVFQIDPLTNKTVKIWNSRKEVRDSGYTGVNYALTKENHIYKNYIWKYK